MKKVFGLLLVVLLLALVPTVALAADDTSNGLTAALETVGDLLLGLLMIAVILERVVEVVKDKISPLKLPNWGWFAITSAIGITICIFCRLDLLGAMGFAGGTIVIVIGCIFSGLFVGAGSGVVHSLQTKLNESKTYGITSAETVQDAGGDSEAETIETSDEAHDTSDGGEANG